MKSPEFDVTFKAIISRISTDAAGGYKIVFHAFEESNAIKRLIDLKDKNCEVTVTES